MRDSEYVYIGVDRPKWPIFHRSARYGGWSRRWTKCGRVRLETAAIALRLGHARHFARPCKDCWTPENAPRPIPFTIHSAWSAPNG